MDNAVTVDIKVNTAKVDAAIAKLERLVGLIKEAKSLADDLASTEINLQISIG